MATIRQVAKACGVSPMTVSYVLNNKAGQVSAETRERVLLAVREMGYRPAAVRRAPEARQFLTLGMLAGVAGDSLNTPGYYNEIVTAIMTAADDRRHNVTVFTNSLFHTDTRRSIRVYCDGRCDGLLVMSPPLDSSLVSALRERGIPFVLVGDTGDDEQVSCVDIDNIGTAQRITEHLANLGHRRIAFVGGADFIRSANQRREGYHRALEARGLSPFDVGPLRRESEAPHHVNQIMRRPVGERPTAFFGWNDVAAVYTLQAIQELGLRVPEQISVIGIDDDSIAAATMPPLTTMRQPYREIGRLAVDILLAQIRGDALEPRRELLPTELITRGTVGPYINDTGD